MKPFTPALLILAACSAGDAAPEKGGAAPGRGSPSVVVDVARAGLIGDALEAVGTANANEQAALTVPVTERIARLRFDDGQFVPRGAVIAELVANEEAANAAQADARAREAQLQLERLRQLQARGFATRARVDEQEALVATARGQGAVARAQAADRTLRAPFSGRLSLRRVSEGTVVSAQTPIATLVDDSRIKLDFAVPEVRIASLRRGMPAEARSAAYPDRVFRGVIGTVDPLVDPATRSVTVRAILPNPDRALRPGMLLTVRLDAAPRRAIRVPELALLGQGGENFVYRVTDDDRAVRAPVTVGTRIQGMVEIAAGLAEGERLVVDGTVKVRDGGKVRPVSPAQAAAGRPAPAARPAAA